MGLHFDKGYLSRVLDCNEEVGPTAFGYEIALLDCPIVEQAFGFVFGAFGVREASEKLGIPRNVFPVVAPGHWLLLLGCRVVRVDDLISQCRIGAAELSSGIVVVGLRR